MTAESPVRARPESRVRRFRWVYIAPVLAFVALSAWAFASPIGAGPDDDFHLVSIWCAIDGGEQCEAGTSESNRVMSPAFGNVACYAEDGTRSAACQEAVWQTWDGDRQVVERGNFVGEYPPVYYTVMNIFTGSDPQFNALVMRLFNAAVFVALATALALLLPVARRQALLWGWLIALVPLGMFLIPSNNPSGWAITGVGTAFLALLGWFETAGLRRWALGLLYVVGVVMAAGARGDAAVYAAGATITVLILTGVPTRAWLLRAILPVFGLVVAFAFFAGAGQAGIGAIGFTSGAADVVPVNSPASDESLSSITFGLASRNLLELPFLWTGVWGSWGLGWLDTKLPSIVPWAATAAFIAVGFAGLGRLTPRKAISVGGVLLVLIVLPVYVLTVGGNAIGQNLQPRYLLPLIVLLCFLLIIDSGRGPIRFSRVQTVAILGALAGANFIALHVNLRRYVTGLDQQGVNLSAGAEWWWTGFPVGPTVVWLVGALAFAGLLALLWPQLRGRSLARERQV
jgi:hypothetical protein